MYGRREMKKNARKSLKKHYWMFVFVCLLAGFLGVKYGSAIKGPKASVSVEYKEETAAGQTKTTVVSGLLDTTEGKSFQKAVGSFFDRELSRAGINKNEMFGRSRGVLASLINMISSGTLWTTLISGITSLTGSRNAALAAAVIAGLVFMLFLWFYLTNVYSAVSARIFLEGRTYEEVPVSRFLFFVRVKKWTNASLVMLRTTVYLTLWHLTLIGGLIKSYSYRMVPYIVAENPAIAPGKAITLSRKIMNGHKMECLVLELTFLGWDVLNILTFGISGVLFSNPYREAVFGEYYAHLRALAKERQVEGTSELKDSYLFARADREELLSAYGKEMEIMEEQEPSRKGGRGILGWIADIFGVALVNDEQEREYGAWMARRSAYLSMASEMSAKAYPDRLSPLPEAGKHEKSHNFYCERHYSIWSLILMFFLFSVFGWVWEVSLHLISNGEFVNRGVLHGPWLPIYGMGGMLILIALNKFRSRPAAEFLMTIVLCGCLEYFMAWYLETTHGGQKWWDYSGYFLNLHGRICAEGLLVFGLGGMAIVYFAAPLLDNLIQKIHMKVLVPLCLALLVLYCADQVYSSDHPNMGKGITDYAAAEENMLFREMG